MSEWLFPENAEDIFPEKAVAIETKKKTSPRSLS